MNDYSELCPCGVYIAGDEHYRHLKDKLNQYSLENSDLRAQLRDALQKIDDVGTMYLAIVAGRDERIVELRAEIRRLRPKNWTVAK